MIMNTTSTPVKTPMPRALPGFEHVRRFWNPNSGRWNAKILPGEFFVTRGNEVITTVLGSCISACIRDPALRIGGMNHFMLPEDKSLGRNAWMEGAGSLATRYGFFAMESLINELMKLGADRRRFEVKLFGGGRIISTMSDVGAQNIAFVRKFLRTEQFQVTAEDLGADCPRHVEYCPDTGLVRLKRLQPLTAKAVLDEESSYRKRLMAPPRDDDVELFN